MQQGAVDKETAISPNAPQPGRGRVWVIIDASNASRGSTTPGQPPQLTKLEAVEGELDKYDNGHDAIADASLRHRIDNPEGLNRLFKEGKVLQAPARFEADPFILQLAQRRRNQGYRVYLLTNDQYKEHQEGSGFPHIGFIVTREGWVLSQPEIQTLGSSASGRVGAPINAPTASTLEVVP